MRQSHQKSRSRGRNRKPQNPLSRNYESNGPDIKIRGNAGHIAEKYSTLARDALSNGDTVMAENYHQHAEHYNRLIAAAQAQRAEEQAAMNNGRGPQPDVNDASNQGANAAGDEQPSVNEEAAEADSSDENTSDAKPRRNTRSRRPRKQAAEADDASADSNGSVTESDEAKVNGAGDADAGTSGEAISEDAASLPQSITGGAPAEDA